MDKRFLAGVVATLTVAGIAAIIIGDESNAAPFNMVTTRRTDSAFVTSVCVDRLLLADGGVIDMMRSTISIPASSTLADGGTLVSSELLQSGGCQLSGAVKTAFDNFADGAALVCARATNQLER